MSARLDGRTALVTGAGRGIGRAIALRLAADGATIAVNDVNAEGAGRTAEEITALGARAVCLTADVSDPVATEAMGARLAAELGGLDILVNNAGIFPWREDWAAIDPAEWDDVMAVNVRGAYLCARAAYPHLRRSGHGRIVNVSSTVWLSGAKSMLHYVTSKAALVGLTRALAREVGDDGITVNAVATGRTLTEGLQGWIDAGHMTEEDVVASRQSQPLKRVGQAEDVAAAVAFLVSDDAAYITAHMLVIDGGRNMH